MVFLRILALFLPLPLHAQPGAAEAVARGEALYALHCLRCHGPTATEGLSGDIRALDIDTITGAVRSGPGMMPLVPLTDTEIADLRRYLVFLDRP